MKNFMEILNDGQKEIINNLIESNEFDKSLVRLEMIGGNNAMLPFLMLVEEGRNIINTGIPIESIGC